MCQLRKRDLLLNQLWCERLQPLPSRDIPARRWEQGVPRMPYVDLWCSDGAEHCEWVLQADLSTRVFPGSNHHDVSRMFFREIQHGERGGWGELLSGLHSGQLLRHGRSYGL